MIHSRRAFVCVLLCSGGLLGIPTLFRTAQAGRTQAIPVADASLVGWVDQRVAEWQPTRAERRFDEVGWTRDIQTAERLAKQHGRPVFLFTHDGRMATGRC